MRASRGPCHLFIQMLPTHREGVRNVRDARWYKVYTVHKTSWASREM
jgi:hypothetical protein